MENLPQPTFDYWILVFGGFAFIGLFYGAGLIGTKHSRRMDRLMGLYLILQSIMLLEYVLFWSNLIYGQGWAIDVSFTFPLLYGPLLYIFFDDAFGNDKPLGKYWLHFLPFVVTLGLKVPFYFSSTDTKLNHVLDVPFGQLLMFYPWFKIVHMLCYSASLFVMISKRSGVGYMRSWARLISSLFLTFTLLTLTYEISFRFGFYTLTLDYILSLTSVSSIALVAWSARSYGHVTAGMNLSSALKLDRAREIEHLLIERKQPHEPVDKYHKSKMPESMAATLARDLEKLMNEEKLYRQNDLKLERLAERLGTTRHFVSQVINQTYKMHFFDYINMKRIQEAKELLRASTRQELNVIEVAYMTGFNNKGTFNAVFKKVTGMTPTEFRVQSQHLVQSRDN